MSQKHNGTMAILTVVAIFFATALPCFAAGESATAGDAADSSGTGTLSGVILEIGGKKKAGRAVIHAYHIDTGKVVSSEPSGPNGGFELKGVPSGYLDLAVEYGGEIFIANQVVNMPPSGKLVLKFILSDFGRLPAEEALGGRDNRFPGTDKTAAGYASIKTKLRGREFWRSPKGIAIIAGGGGLALLGIAAGGENDASAFIPTITD